MRSLLIIFGGLPLWCVAQTDEAVDITIVDRIPLRANTVLFMDSLHSKNELHILSNKIQIDIAPRLQNLESAYYYELNKPIKIRQPQLWEYRTTINQATTKDWQALPTNAFGTGVMKTAFNLIDTVLNFGDRLLVQLRNVGTKEVLQQFNVYCTALTPQLLYYRKKAINDTIDNSFIARNLTAFKKLAASFDSLNSSIITIQAGFQLQCLLKPNFLNKDSCIEFRLFRSNVKDTSWFTSGHLLSLPLLASNEQYQLELRYKGSHHIRTYTINVQPYWYETVTAILVFAFAALVCLYGMYRYRMAQLQKGRKQLLEQLNQLQVKLNPHFVYNALGSIEGLVQEQNTKKVNYYLQAFSGILRSSLLNSQNLLIPLRQDIDLLEKYILLEQLHYGFTYQIQIDPQLNVEAVEFPPMILQPMVENAIKHGVIGLGSRGKIEIKYAQQAQHLSIQIIDNGNGIGKNSGTGTGKQITLERVDRLRRFLKQGRIDCTITHGQNGTIVEFFFENWISD